MSEGAVFLDNSSGKLISHGKNLLTDPVYNLSSVNKTSLSLDLKNGDQTKKIELISFIEKEPKLGFYKATSESIAEWQDRWGDTSNDIKQNIKKGIAAEILFKNETNNIMYLNQKGNVYVPKITDSRENYYKMTFIRGVGGAESARLQLNPETKLMIVKKTLEAVKSVFDDGIIDLEYMPKNSILVPNLKTGILERVILIDFGISFKIDDKGEIEVDMDLFKDANIRMNTDRENVGIFPPELTDKKGKVKIDAGKALVWTLAQRVVSGWLFDVNVAGAKEFMNKATSQNPEDRWSLNEFISYFDQIKIDESKIGSCVPKETLKSNQEMLGRPDTEVSIDEKQVERIIEELKKLKESQTQS